MQKRRLEVVMDDAGYPLAIFSGDRSTGEIWGLYHSTTVEIWQYPLADSKNCKDYSSLQPRYKL
jgi:hypothetical protein